MDGDQAWGAIRDGVDSYVITGGLITAQTIHYTVMSAELSVTWGVGDRS